MVMKKLSFGSLMPARYKPSKLWYVNAIGAVGYLFLAYATTIALCYMIIAVMELTVTGGMPSSPSPIINEPSSQSDPSLAVSIVGYLITALVVAVSLVILIALPYIVGRYLSRLTHGFHRLLRINPTNRDFLLLKSLVGILMLVVLLVINLFEIVNPILQSALLVTQLIVVVVTIGLFVVQHLLARRSKLRFEQIW